MHRPVIHITAGRLLLFRNGATVRLHWTSDLASHGRIWHRDYCKERR